MDAIEPLLIVTDENGNDLVAISDFELDMAFGADENDFSAKFSSPVCVGGELIYMDGTEYGGVIDRVKDDTDSSVLTYEGRTWHGILASKVLCPDKGKTHLTVSGEANSCIASIMSRCGLAGTFKTDSSSSGMNVSYRFARYVDAYSGLLAMLASCGARLGMRYESGFVRVWAEPSQGHDDADGDLMSFDTTKNVRPVNHLVCLGSGEMENRAVVHLYADANGKVSKTQTFSGIEEVAQTYEYSQDDAEKLEKDGRKKLKELQGQGAVTMDVDGEDWWGIGDSLTASNHQRGQTVTAFISKKIVKVSKGALTVSYEVGKDVRVRTSRTETDASEALAAAFSRARDAAVAASEAKIEAASKRRVFTGRPVPPYDIGDLWTDTETGVMYVCTTSKEA